MDWWLPTDVVDEILLRLPVKSLLRCKAVCRSWCGLIESNTFIKRHYCHESHEERLVFKRGDYVDGAGFQEGNNDRLRLPYLGEDFRYLLGPVNGILCEMGRRGDIVLVNPATRKVKHVPRFPYFKVQDPLQVMFGFGYDASSEDHKIAAFYARETDVFSIYKSSSDRWKRVEVEDPGLLKLMHEGEWYVRNNDTGGFWNGVQYWAVMRDRCCKGMVGFDMMSEKFSEIIRVPDDVVVGDFIKISRHGDSMAVLTRDEFCRVVVKEKGKDGGWSKCLTETLRIKESESLFPVCVWKDQLVVVKVYRKRGVYMKREVWVIREYYLLHLSSPPAAAASSSTPKTGVVRLRYFDTALASASFFHPFSYKESLFAI